jgi:predicted aspartyl protease
VTKQQKQFVEQGFERDRLDYWAMRDELLAKYAGKWVAVHKGRVIAVADEPVSLMDQALADDGYAYTNKVGEEDKIVIRQRRVSFPYDTTYSPTPLPRLAAVLYNFAQTKSKVVNDAVPDTGADVTCLPMNDCQDLDVLLFPFYTGISHPFAGVRRSVTFYGARVEVDGKVYNAIVEPVAAAERLLGRDVLNRMKVTFDGPSLTTIVD